MNQKIPNHEIQIRVITWFKKNKRSLPWRRNRTWYNIWISEVMLQQTQVEQVIPYYHKFIEKFKTVKQLARSSEEEVLKLWEGMGYYTRARNLFKTAKILVDQYDAKLPSQKEELLKLPGFGPYITHAILSLAYDLPYGVVDGNIKRVVSRLFALPDDIRASTTHSKIQKLMDRLLPAKSPGEFNEAMMELGAVVCNSHSPLCCKCPISDFCLANKRQIQNYLPFKTAKAKIPVIKFTALIIKYEQKFLAVKRPIGEMLAGMWEFPMVKMVNGETVDSYNAVYLNKHFNLQAHPYESYPEIIHSYTHFQLKLYSKLFFSLTSEFNSDFYKEYRWITLAGLKKLPLHRAMWKVLDVVESNLKIISK